MAVQSRHALSRIVTGVLVALGVFSLGPIAGVLADDTDPPGTTPGFVCEGYCSAQSSPTCDPPNGCIPCCCKSGGAWTCMCTIASECIDANNEICSGC
jgi:hypothetical protein